MNEFLGKILTLISEGKIRISSHGYDELSEDTILVRDLVNSIKNAIVIEEYPDFPKGPCILVLQYDKMNNPVHAVWGIPSGFQEPAVLVTAYKPDPGKWTEDFTRRIK